MDLNYRQRQIVRGWPKLFKDVFRHNWKSAAFGYASGTLIATLVNIGSGTWKSSGDKFATYWKLVNAYAPNVWFILVPIAITATFALGAVTWRAFQSWRY